MSEAVLTDQRMPWGWEQVLALPEGVEWQVFEEAPMLPVGMMVLAQSDAEMDTHRRTLAFDSQKTEIRYQQLRDERGETEARQLLLDELVVDLATHGVELTGKDGDGLAFSWRYGINSEGILIKDAASEMPIKEMFVGLSDAASRLWRERLIGVLEEMPVGAMATTLSSRQDGQQFEGVYDFLYVFHKVDKNTIWAYGLGAQLNRFEQVAVNNTQAVVARNNWLLLDTGATADEIRGRAFAYPPDWFDSPMALYTWLFESAGILKDQNEIQTQFDVAALRQADKLVAMRPVAEEMVEHIFLGHSTQRLVQREQMRQLWLAYPDEMGGWRDRGLLGVMLPCGWVDLGFDLGMTAGDGLLMTSFGVECVQKKCRRCGNTDIAETDTKCRICSWSPGNSV